MWESFMAFNINGLNHLGYTFVHNLWTIIMVAAAVIITIISVMSAVETTVTDEQNIL